MLENGLSRKEREREQHRNEILEAALILFSEKGYENVSVSEIAEKAEFATGTLYNFFESKEDLFREVVRKHLKSAQECLEHALDSDDDELSGLKAFIRAKGTFVQDHLNFVRLYMHDLRRPAFLSVQKEVMPVIGTIHARLEALFRKGIKRGIFKNHDPYILSVSFDGLSSVFIFQMIHFPDKFNYFEHIDTMMEMFFGNILIKDSAERT